MLTLIATPIGNLEDISQRALKALQNVDAILCEDTRKSRVLLQRYGIDKPLISYHKFKEKKALERILADLEAGKHLALISDAGTPCINDPGQLLVDACRERGLAVEAIPGPCSLVQALVLSGFAASRFQFIGFLPKKPEGVLKSALFFRGVTLAFESPERLVATLEILHRLHPERQIAIAREMTKTFEECRRGSVKEILHHYRTHPPKGEIVLVIAEGEMPQQEIEIEELVALLQEEHGLSLKEAIKLAARLQKKPKSQIYQKIHVKAKLK